MMGYFAGYCWDRWFLPICDEYISSNTNGNDNYPWPVPLLLSSSYDFSFALYI